MAIKTKTVQHNGVLPTKAKGVDHCRAYAGVPGGIGDVVEVAGRVWRVEPHGRWHDLVHDAPDGSDRCQCASRTGGVAQHRLDAADGDMRRVRPKCRMDGGGFGAVVHAGGGGVGADMVDVGR